MHIDAIIIIIHKYYVFTLSARSCSKHFASICICLVAQSRPTLCDPMNCSPPGSSVHGIFQAGILEWAAFPPAGHLPNPGIELASPVFLALAGQLYHCVTWEATVLQLKN